MAQTASPEADRKPHRKVARKAGRTAEPPPALAGTDPEIVALLEIWAASLETDDPGQVAALYAEDAVLVPTVSNLLRRGRAGITAYFTRFLAKRPRARMHQIHVQRMGDIAIASGVYLFCLTKEAGSAEVPARFTFVCRREGAGWIILSHHSSYMPERGAF